MKKNTLKVLSLLLLFALLLSACKTEKVEKPPVVINESTAVALTVSAVTPIPTGGETEVAPPSTPDPGQSNVLEPIEAEILLWAPQSADANLTQNLDGQLQSYSTLNKLKYERREQFAASQLGDTTRLVVSLAGDGELRAMADARSQTQFLAIVAGEGTWPENVHTLSQTQVLPEQQSFLAGLILAMSTPDYRVGVISQSDNPAGEIAKGGFVTGARYFCGLCNARYTPVLYYPMTAEVESPTGVQAAVDALMAQSVTAVYLQPELSSPEVIDYLNTKGLATVGIEGQAGIESAQGLVAMISSGKIGDISPFVERILAGESLGALHVGLELTHVNEEKLTSGRRVLFERFKEDLLNGEIKALPHGQ